MNLRHAFRAVIRYDPPPADEYRRIHGPGWRDDVPIITLGLAGLLLIVHSWQGTWLATRGPGFVHDALQLDTDWLARGRIWAPITMRWDTSTTTTGWETC